MYKKIKLKLKGDKLPVWGHVTFTLSTGGIQDDELGSGQLPGFQPIE